MKEPQSHRAIIEYAKCSRSPAYFILTYCFIYEASEHIRDWIPFDMWPSQEKVLADIEAHKLFCVLKARQLGLTWLVLAYAVWVAIFKPGSVILLFSRTDTEAKELLRRVKGICQRLPEFLRATVTTDNDHEFVFGGLGTRIQSFATTKNAGRSMTATLVIMDEADFMVYFEELMTAVKPTIDGGGKLIMLSTPDKERPQSGFKHVWKRGHAGENGYKAVFLPWSARPDRTEAWYRAIESETPDTDKLHQEYPATPAQALAGNASTKRFDSAWLDRCSDFSVKPIPKAGPAIPGLAVYTSPRLKRKYVIGVDTCEGDVVSDPSPATVFDAESWEEVAHFHGRYEATALAGYLASLAAYYNQAVICVERNNHGHAVHVALNSLEGGGRAKPKIYKNPFDMKLGWLSSAKYKVLAMDNAATAFQAGDCTFHTEATVLELAGIEASSLKALEGDTDDRAMTAVIGLAALRWPSKEVNAEIPRSFSIKA